MAPHQFPFMRRGVSLVEALVALAVMAFGMLALVGVQATMRLNSDVAKQRGEATRIATEEIERLRGFIRIRVIDGEPLYTSYDGILGGTPVYAAAGGVGNTAYTVTRIVNTAAGAPLKSIAVRVNWFDRSDQAQSVTLETAIGGTDPALAGLLAILPTASATNRAGGRDDTIPKVAVDLGNGSSAFKPVEFAGVVWMFNNLTGLISSRCTGVTAAQKAINAATMASAACDPLPVEGRLLAGIVKFDLRNPLPNPTASASESPAGPALPLHKSQPLSFSTSGVSPVGQSNPTECLASSPVTLDVMRLETAYYCLVFTTLAQAPDVTGWGGKLNVNLAGAYSGGTALPSGTTTNDYRICRYTTANTDFTLNANHPKSYCMETNGTATIDVPCTGNKVTRNLIKQDFLVIVASQNCPTDVAPNPSAGDLVNSNTLPHAQP